MKQHTDEIMKNSFRYYLLFCSERSGSNFMMDFMERHTETFALPVSHIVRLMMTNRLKFGDFVHDDAWYSFLEFCQSVIETGTGSYGTQINLNTKALQKCKARHIFTILDSMVSQSGFKGKNVIIKENLVFEFLPSLLPFGRISGIIYQVRNPLGTVSSVLRSPNHFGDVEHASQKWNREQLAFLRAIGYVCDAIPHLLLRYEDVVAHPAQIASHLNNFFPSQPVPDEARPKDGGRTTISSSFIDNLKQVDGTVKTDRNHIASLHLRPEEIDLITRTCSGLMQLFGYIHSSHRQPLNLYPEWLCEMSPGQLFDAIQSSQLSDAEKKLRQERNTLIKRLMRRPIDSCSLGGSKFQPNQSLGVTHDI